MSDHSKDDPFSDYTIIGNLTTEEKAALLREMGDETTAEEFVASLPTVDTKSVLGSFLSLPRKPRAWEHTSYSFGFLPASTPLNEPMPLLNASQIEPDTRLRNAAVTIRLDKIRIADYPGRGTHRILFDFYAHNAVAEGQQEHLHYNATFRAREGQEAAAVGLPIFVNLNVGNLGLAFRCNTINVANEGSQKALDVLESDLVRAGLQLANTMQPAIAPLSQIALSLTKAILGTHKNVRVQDFQLGLDFETAATGARLAQGSYFAVQVEDASTWDWSEWVWHPGRACLMAKSAPETLCPYNYIVFRVSRHLDY